MHLAPHHGDAAADIDAAGQYGRHADGNFRQRKDQVLGQMRAGGVAAAAAEFNPDGVRCRGDGADPGAYLSYVHTGIAVQRQDTGHPVQGALLDDGERTAGHDFLRGLENHPHPSAQLAGGVKLCQHAGNTEHDSGVDIVPAGMGDAGVHGGEGQPCFFQDRQGVNVCSQCQPEGTVANVHDGAGTFQPLGRKAGVFEGLHNAVGGPEFFQGQLGMRVEVPPEIDQLAQERSHASPYRRDR